MLDSDLAKLYHVETKRINEAVKNNREKFPERFSWKLTEEESKMFLVEIFDQKNIETRGGRYRCPRVFTEQGVAMLATILKSKVAIQVSIRIMDAFVAMRKYISNDLQDDLYKDKVKGIVPEEDYIELTGEFAKDRDSYIKEKSELEKLLNQKDTKKEDINKLEKLAKEFISLEKPTKQLLNELIEKITISENHEITIYYKFSELNQFEKDKSKIIREAEVINTRNKKAS